jgi:hypothetical protein
LFSENRFFSEYLSSRSMGFCTICFLTYVVADEQLC